MKQLKPMAALTLAVTISSSGIIVGVSEASAGDAQEKESSPTASTPMSAQQGNQAISPQSGMSGMQGPLSGMSGMGSPFSGMSGMQVPQSGMSGMQGTQSGMTGMQGTQSGMSGMQGPYSGMQMTPEQYGGMSGMQGQPDVMIMRPWQQEQGGMPMMYGHPGVMQQGFDQYSGMPAPYVYHGGRPMMGHRGMRNNRMMGQFQETRQRHMQTMEARMAKIEALLNELVELTKEQKSSK